MGRASGRAALRSDGRVGISLDAEHFFSAVLGKLGTHGLAGWRPKRSWHRLCRRLVNHLDRYIKANVVTDRPHHRALEQAIRGLHRAVDAVDADRESEILTSFAALCLLLVGGVPDHWNRRGSINHPKIYVLSAYRSLHYSQTPSQIARLIWKDYIGPQVRNRDRATAKMKALDSIYWRHCRRHSEADFVAMFRTQYPEEYCKLFA